MFKALSSFPGQKINIVSNEFNNYLCNTTRYQCVRWKRKPWWLPTAKSKLYRVPERKKLPPAEEEELKKLWNNYRTEMKSIRHYMKEKLQSSMTGPEVLAEQARLAEEDHKNCIKLNDKWNEEVRKIREARIANEKEKEIETIMRELELKEQKEKERLEEIEAIVRIEKEKSKSYITSANIDAALEEALSKEIDYNFAIDLECNIHQGRIAKPDQEPPPQEIEKIAQAN